MKNIIYVGIDVHKTKFSACCYKVGTQSYLAGDAIVSSNSFFYAGVCCFKKHP